MNQRFSLNALRKQVYRRGYLLDSSLYALERAREVLADGNLRTLSEAASVAAAEATRRRQVLLKALTERFGPFEAGKGEK